MTESRTTGVRRIEFEVDWPPGHVACYLLARDEPVLVDAGVPGEFDGAVGDPDETLADGLGAVGLDVADVDHLVVTHPHVDHVGQVPRILDEADPTVYAPAGVRERFGRDPEGLARRVRANAAVAGIAGDQLEAAVEVAVESLRRDASLLPPGDVDVWLEPGSVSVGPLRGEAVYVPGHQADHLCYLVDVDEEQVLLAGDVAIEPFRTVVLHDGLDDGYREAFEAFFAGLDRLAGLDVDRVFPGHGPGHERFDEVVERDRDSLDGRLDAVEDHLADGRRTGLDVATALAGDRHVRYLLPETMSALAHLERTGRATVAAEDGVHHYEST